MSPQNMQESGEISTVLRAGARRILCHTSPGEQIHGLPAVQTSAHSYVEFLFTVRGTSLFPVNGMDYRIRPGDVFVIDSWIPHAMGYRKTDRDLIHLWIHMGTDYLSCDLLRVTENGRYDKLNNMVILPDDICRFLRRRWEQMKQKGEITQESLAENLRSPLNALLEEVAFSLQKPVREETSSISIVDAVKKFIQANSGRNCSLAEIESFTGYSRYHLAHLFRTVSGSTIKDYIDRVRIQYTASAQLRGIRNKEIAAELGFSSCSTFCVWRKKHREPITLCRKQLKASAGSE